LKSTREALRDLRFRVLAKQHKGVRDLRQIKRDVAKIHTVLKEKAVLKKLKNNNQNNGK